MNQASFEDPDDFRHQNRLTEYFRQLDEEKASNANEHMKGTSDETHDSQIIDSDVENSSIHGGYGALDGDDSETEVERRYFPEDMLTPQFFEPCLQCHLKGDLRAFLYALGLGDDENVARVQSLFEQRIPTLQAESDHLFALMEHELAQMCLGGVTRAGDFTDEGFVLDVKVEERRLKAMELLAFVRIKRLEWRSKSKPSI